MLDREFIRKLEKIGGRSVYNCMQCGVCSGMCPMSAYMDELPRKVMRMSQLGLNAALDSCNTAWICATCFSCSVRCPRGTDIPKVMEAIRQMTQRRNINRVEPSGIPKEELSDLPQIALIGCFRKHTA